MRKFIFLIGSTDDFESLEDLKETYFNNGLEYLNADFYEFELPMNCSDEIVELVGRGLFFENGWCMDDTFSCVLEA